MEQEGEEEEAAADQGLATASAWCWCIMDYEQVGYHRSAEQLYRSPTSFAIVAALVPAISRTPQANRQSLKNRLVQHE